MSNSAKSSPTPDQPESAKPTELTKSETRHRRLCKAARLICVLAAITLSISAIVCLIMSIMDFAAAPPSTGKSGPDGSLLPESKVGDSECHSYVAIGENYTWPMPQLRFHHHSYSTITGIDEADRSRTLNNKSQTGVGVVAWARPGIAQEGTAGPPMAQASAADEALPELLYPGRSHEPCKANTGAVSRPLIALDTVFKLSWYALCLFAVIQMHRLFSHCLNGSILDEHALGICRRILVCYTAMLILGPLSLYVFNLVSSSGVAHIIAIPYAGVLLWLVLSSMHALMRKAGHLKSEVDATI